MWDKGLTERGRPAVIAHRGASALAAENSAEAFRLALSLGVDGVETDARLTGDGIAIAFHDRDLMRLAGDPRPVAEVESAELANLMPELMRLDAAAAAILAGAGLLLDLKETEEARILALLAQISPVLGDVRTILGVRSPASAALLRKAAPAARLLSLAAPAGDAPGAPIPGCDWLRLWEDHATPARIGAARADGLKVLVMMGAPTAEGSGRADAESVARIAALQPDAICLDDAALALRVLAAA